MVRYRRNDDDSAEARIQRKLLGDWVDGLQATEDRNNEIKRRSAADAIERSQKIRRWARESGMSHDEAARRYTELESRAQSEAIEKSIEDYNRKVAEIVTRENDARSMRHKTTPLSREEWEAMGPDQRMLTRLFGTPPTSDERRPMTDDERVMARIRARFSQTEPEAPKLSEMSPEQRTMARIKAQIESSRNTKKEI